uniref:TGF-beta-activated kinase 1 and MAP3K7-binding protein 3 n=1 Tax=Lygus hesperus TaxID=30085 RepID=A0A0A9YW21_LYGHE
MAERPGKKNIQRSHLFFIYKQKYPNIPDQIVSHCIATAGGDEKATEELLESPEYSKYRLPKPNNVSLVDKSPEEACAGPLKASCRITRHVPPGLPKSPFPPLLTPSFNHGTSAVFNNFFNPIKEQPVANPDLLDRIERQLRNKRNLEVELNKHRKRHADLRTQIAKLKSSLDASRASDKIEKLTKDVNALRKDCAILNAEYNGLPIKSTAEVHITATNGGEGISWGTEAWHCEMCTFRNHHLLNQCETCCMPRINVGINAV